MKRPPLTTTSTASTQTAAFGTSALILVIAIILIMALTGCKAVGNFTSAIGDGIYAFGESIDHRSNDHKAE